jgi:hypothetical protein
LPAVLLGSVGVSDLMFVENTFGCDLAPRVHAEQNCAGQNKFNYSEMFHWASSAGAISITLVFG